MEIKITSIAKRLRIPLPDLITRPTGKRIYRAISKKIIKGQAYEVIILDFEGIQVVDPSCADEIIVRLIEDSRKSETPFYIRLKHISIASEKNIASVFDSYSRFKSYRMAVATEELTSHNNYCIGLLNEKEQMLLKYLKINKIGKYERIAQALNLSEQESQLTLDTLHNLHLVRKTGPETKDFLIV